LHLHLRVDLSASRRTLVPDGGDEGADQELLSMNVVQGLDPSPEGPKANLASEGKPRIINPAFLNLCNYVCYDCALTFQELI
jgi:hypothetical protein